MPRPRFENGDPFLRSEHARRTRPTYIYPQISPTCVPGDRTRVPGDCTHVCLARIQPGLWLRANDGEKTKSVHLRRHGVDIGQAMKTGALWWRVDGAENDRDNPYVDLPSISYQDRHMFYPYHQSRGPLVRTSILAHACQHCRRRYTALMWGEKYLHMVKSAPRPSPTRLSWQWWLTVGTHTVKVGSGAGSGDSHREGWQWWLTMGTHTVKVGNGAGSGGLQCDVGSAFLVKCRHHSVQRHTRPCMTP